MGFDLSNDSAFNGVFTYDTSAIESSFRQNHPDKHSAICQSGLVDYKVSIGVLSYSVSI